MGTETFPPLCVSAVGALALLLVAGLVPWVETILVLGVIAVFHGLPLRLKRLDSQKLLAARGASGSVARSRHWLCLTETDRPDSST